jgi:hypothetical protein
MEHKAQERHDKMYRTTELAVASFLKARNHKLLGVQPAARDQMEFTFPAEAAADVANYFAGAEWELSGVPLKSSDSRVTYSTTPFSV